ncbi:histidine phosphatase family protein [soil metagenome]
MRRRIVVWRHGRTEWNARGLAQGQEDVALDDVGVRQAREAAARVAALSPARIMSSDLQRASTTATILSELCGVPVELDRRLREMHLGARQGMPLAEAFERYPAQMRAWRAGEDVRLEGGETYAETAGRFAAALEDLSAALGQQQTAVMVSHGAAMRVGICHWLGFPQPLWGRFGGFANCSGTVLEEDRLGWRITEWNAGSLPEPVLSDDPSESADDP